MANRPKGYGLTAEVKSKMSAKYDDNLDMQARAWMEAVVGENLDCSGPGSAELQKALKDGVYLCKLASVIKGSPVKFNTSKMAFKQMENIGKFLDFCFGYGMAKTDVFQTVDLFEAQNMSQVVLTIHALGRKSQTKGFLGPTLGPKE